MTRPAIFLSNTGLPISTRPKTAEFVGAATQTGTVAEQLANQEKPSATTPPGGLVLATGTSFNHAYIDVSWTTVASEGIKQFEVRVERDHDGIVSTIRTAELSTRIEPVLSNSTYTIFVYNIMLSGVLGTYSSAVTVAAADTTIPVVPVGMNVGAGLRTLTASWTDNTEPDVAFGQGRYRVQVSTDSGFATLIYDKEISGTVVSITDLSPNTQYWIRIAAKDTSNNQSPFTASATVTTIQAAVADLGVDSVDTNQIADFAVKTAKIGLLAVDNAQIALLAVDSAQIADAAITTLQVKDAQITSAKIVSLTAAKITAGTINGQLIVLKGVGGIFRSDNYVTGPTGAGFMLSGDGNFEANTGVFRGTLDAATITGSQITGGTIEAVTFQTAATGKRLVIDTLLGAGKTLRFYSDTGTFYSYFGWDSTGNQPFRWDSDLHPIYITTFSFYDPAFLVSTVGTITLDGAAVKLEPFARIHTTGADGGLHLGEVFGVSYVGMRTENMSGGEYMIISDGTSTFISAGVGGGSYLRSGNNGGGGGIVDEVAVTTDQVDITVNNALIMRATPTAAVLKRSTTTSATGFADIGFGQVGTYSSRRRLKTNIRPVVAKDAIVRIKGLEPSEFEFRPEVIGDGTNLMVAFDTQRGFIAEDVAAVDPVLAVYDWIDPANPDFMHPLVAQPEDETMQEWIDKNVDLADAVPTMWNDLAVITDLVAVTQDLLDRIEVLEGQKNKVK